jgi:hypothetical protein
MGDMRGEEAAAERTLTGMVDMKASMMGMSSCRPKVSSWLRECCERLEGQRGRVTILRVVHADLVALRLGKRRNLKVHESDSIERP